MNAHVMSRCHNTGLPVVAITLVLLGGSFFAWSAATLSAQSSDTRTGVLVGSVTADRGEVRAFRVKARDSVHRIAYTVFTRSGRYQIYHLPPSTYEVQVLENGFESPVERVEVTAGEMATVDLTLTATGVGAVQGVAARGADQQRSYGGRRADGRAAELVDFDTLYPPSPARDVMLRSCFGCHGPAGFHSRGPKTEAGWRRAVHRMFDPNGRVARMAPGIPQITYDTVSADEEESIVQYLTDNFGPDSELRDLELDPLVRDEDALAQAVYIQYELSRNVGEPFADGSAPRLGGHSAFASLREPGVVWISGSSSNSIIRVDTRVLDYAGRTKEFRVSNPENLNTTPHGILEHDGRVFWVELSGDHLGELNPATGIITRYPMPTKGAGPHSAWADSRGNIWYTYFASAGRIGRFNSHTEEFTEWEPLEGWSGYGIVVDRQDRVWAVGLHTHATLMYNQETQEWKSYPMTNPARRPAVDGNGKVWAAHYYGNTITMIDPVTDEVTSYELPLKDGNPYDIWPDDDNNLWIENGIYDSLVKFDQQTKEFTYFPFPELSAHTPKLDLGSDGTLWFTLGSPRGLAAFKPKGNVGE